MGANDQLLKGVPGEPALKSDIQITDTDQSTVLLALSLSGFLKLGNIASSLTAHSGGGQASALALTKPVNVVSTVAVAADSVKLPASTGKGQVVIVSNQAAANSMQLFGAGTDTINGVATATGIAVAAGKTALCVDFGAGTWLAMVA